MKSALPTQTQKIYLRAFGWTFVREVSFKINGDLLSGSLGLPKRLPPSEFHVHLEEICTRRDKKYQYHQGAGAFADRETLAMVT